jgi:predicted  nucleic acid-binding Zn-ribbon protein
MGPWRSRPFGAAAVLAVNRLERLARNLYRPVMASDEPRGFSIDIEKILKDVTGTRRRTSRSRSTSSSDMDAALRRAVRVELGDVERSLKLLADEVVRLRKANEALATQIAKLAKR